jgi:hypothetical protein
MSTAQMEAEARRLIAAMVADGEAGKLDDAMFLTLKAGLAARKRAGS